VRASLVLESGMATTTVTGFMAECPKESRPETGGWEL